jgi:hypothetical protein
MLITAIVCFVLSVGACALVDARLFLYRHDQAWRRERGAVFGDSPLGLGWEIVHRKADYLPEGQRLIPLSIALRFLAVFFIVAAVLARAV